MARSPDELGEVQVDQEGFQRDLKRFKPTKFNPKDSR